MIKDKYSKYTNSPAYPEEFKSRKLELVKEFAPFVKKIAGRFSLRLSPDIDQDDLIQVGMIGLLEAIDRYNPNEAANFKTYAEYRIRGSILDELRARDWIPRSVRANATRLEKATLDLRKKGIETPNHQELADELGIKLDEFEDFLNRNVSMPLLSLDSLGKKSDQDSLDILDIIENPDEVLSDESLIKKEMVEKLVQALQKLPKREQTILYLAYQEDLNLKEIANVMGLTEARICQLRVSSIAFLRSYLEPKSDG